MLPEENRRLKRAVNFEFWIQMTGQTRSLKVMYPALNGQVHYDFMCFIIGPAGRLFASFNQVETCLQVVWNHGSQVSCLPRHSSQQVLFGVLAVLVAIKHAALLMTFCVVFKSPVRSGFFAFFWKDQDQDWSKTDHKVVGLRLGPFKTSLKQSFAVLGPVWTSFLWTSPEPSKTGHDQTKTMSMILNLVSDYLEMLFSCFRVLIKVIVTNQGYSTPILYKQLIKI